MSKKNRRGGAKQKGQPQAAQTARPSRITVSIIALVLLITMGVLIWLVWDGQLGNAAPSQETPAVTADATGQTQVRDKVARADACRTQPKFVAGLPVSLNAMIGTSTVGVTGLSIIDPASDPNESKILQLPTWDMGGNLGPYVIDGEGNIFAGATPMASLELNPPDKQNIIYRVDTNTGEMKPWIDLPAAQPPSATNPFGILGMGFDCFTQSIYVATVSGSTPTEEVGRIYQIERSTGAILDQIDNVDAMGVGVATLPSGERRLYYGLARSSEVRSVRLELNGNFTSGEAEGDFRSEFALATLQGGQNDRAQRITFDADGVMQVKGVQFTYSLQVTAQVPIATYRMRYVQDASATDGAGQWELIDVTREER